MTSCSSGHCILILLCRVFFFTVKTNLNIAAKHHFLPLGFNVENEPLQTMPL